MKQEPLFIKFANGEVNILDVLERFLSTTQHEPTKKIIEKAKDTLPDLSVFRKDFAGALMDLIESGINQHFINYVDSYMKPSLEEFVEGSGGSRSGEKRWVQIKAEDAPWVEAVVCYNLCLYIRMYGIKELKRCPKCMKFFSNKGKYAKYCSDICKPQER
jgi:hypothetical protein